MQWFITLNCGKIDVFVNTKAEYEKKIFTQRMRKKNYGEDDEKLNSEYE